MAIIYTYPTKGKAADADLIIISDSEEKKMTKQISVGNLLADIKEALDLLEKLVAVNTENIASLTSIIGTLQEQVAALEECCVAFNKFADAQTVINLDFEARIAKLEASPIGDLSELEKEVENIKEDVDTNTGDITDLDKEVDANTKEIESVKEDADANTKEIETVKETADNAAETAAVADGKATKASADATNAGEAASAADSKADEAQAAADAAGKLADEAQSAAETADGKATEAQSAAETATSTATEANTAAAKANEAAAAAESSASEALKASVDGVEAKATIDGWEENPASSPFAPAEAEEPPVEE